MKAIIWTKYGQPNVLQLREVEKPVPGVKEILIKIHSATVTAGDCEMRNLKFSPLLRLMLLLYNGFLRPKRIKILGQELAGEVESVGKDVETFKIGDQVFAATEFSMGAYAEYICLPGNFAIALKPSKMTYEEAAAIPVGGFNALHFLRDGIVKHGQKVLIIGAGGSIGTIAIQLAKLDGAEITGVDSPEKLEMLLRLGADHVIDFTKEDFSKNENTYDIILDVAGKSSFYSCIKALKKDGLYLITNPRLSSTIQGKWTSITSSKKVISGTASYTGKDLNILKELIESGKLKSEIDKIYPLDQVVEAHRYVEAGHKKGNVVIKII
jgi:2-desacetyl-2-hydroxyethyl bacteriochlorophyllide A dehydrogenase